MTLKDMAKKYQANEFNAEALPGSKPTVEISVTFMRGKVKYRHVSIVRPDPDELDKVDAKIQSEINKSKPKTPIK